ncbi:MAG: DUF4279 domain-containing protein [Spirochaetota bacterium]
MMREPKCRAFLGISSQSLEPNQISEALNLQPDYVHDSTTPDLQGNRMQGLWQLHSTLDASEPLENHLTDILKKLAPARQIFKDAIKGCQAGFYCSVEYSAPGVDGFSLSPRIMTLIGSLGIELHIDTWLEEEASDSLAL